MGVNPCPMARIPDSARKSVGFLYSRRWLSAIFSSFLIGFFLGDLGTARVFALIAVSMPAVLVSVGMFGPRTGCVAL
jgi:hypothetical protein